MNKLPGVLLVIDVRREHLAVREAKRLGIPTICLIDTDSDPDYADIPIPGNDDSMRSIEKVLEHASAAIEEGKRARKAAPVDEGRDGPGHPGVRLGRPWGRADDKPGAADEPAAPAGEVADAEPAPVGAEVCGTLPRRQTPQGARVPRARRLRCPPCRIRLSRAADHLRPVARRGFCSSQMKDVNIGRSARG